MSAEQFFDLLDSAIDKRVEGLAPLLSEQQAQIYQAQTDEFRDKISTLVNHATGAGAASSATLDQP